MIPLPTGLVDVSGISNYLEPNLALRGRYRIAGIDEAGRGAIAGPVVAAAVVLHPKKISREIDDSKKLTAPMRERLADEIRASALAYSIVSVPAFVIDRINILQATLMAMRLAFGGLSTEVDAVFVDGNISPDIERRYGVEEITVTGGDALIASISAASILAKTYRDRLMVQLGNIYSVYDFPANKGYGTKFHRSAVQRYGPCKEHRRTFITRIVSEQKTIFREDS